MEQMNQVIDQHKNDPRQQLIAIAKTYVELGILDTDSVSEDFCATSEMAFDGLMEIIASGQQAGIIKDENPKIIAVTAWSLVHGLMM